MSLWEKKSFRSRRSRKRQYKKHIILSIVWVLFFVLLLIGIWYGVRYSGVTIQRVDVVGGETVSHDAVRDAAQSTLSGSYVLLIPKRFTFFYPHDAVVEAVENISRVADAQVSRSGKIVQVVLSEYTPHALWCEDVHATSTAEQSCLFISRDGYAFAEAPALSGNVLIRYFDESQKSTLGLDVLDAGMMATLHEFSDAIEARHQMRVQTVTHTADNDLIFKTDAGGDLLISGDADIQTVFENLESVLNSNEFKATNPDDFDYIDLRFGNKIYIKEKQAETGVGTSSEISE